MSESGSFTAALARYDRPGRGAVAAGVVQGGVVTLRGEVGWANIEHGVRVNPGTRFQIASLTKQFVAGLTLRLAEAGHFSFDEDMRGRSSALAACPQPITLRHLLSHTSGLIDTFDLLYLAGAGIENPIPAEAVSDLMARQRHMHFEAGQGFAYCNSGFEIVGSILEDAMSATLGMLLERHLFTPLGMTRTLLVKGDDAVVADAANGYLVCSGEARHGRRGFPFNGGAGILATLDDLLSWESHLLGDNSATALLPRLEDVETFPNGATRPYGLGTYVEKWKGLKISGHGGLLPGFVSSVVRCAAEGTAAVVVSNSGDVDANELSRALLQMAIGDRAYTSVPKRPNIAPGRYYEPVGNELFDIRKHGDGLQALTHGWLIGLVAQPDGSATFDDPLLDRLLLGSSSPSMIEWGQTKSLVEVPPWTNGIDDLGRFSGSFGCDELPTIFEFCVSDGALVLSIDGAFGQQHYPLERVDSSLFHGGSKPGQWLPLDLVIVFDDDKSGSAWSLRVTTGRTKGLLLHRRG